MQLGTSEGRAQVGERPGPSLRSCTARPLESDRVSMLKTSSSTPARRARSTQRRHHSSMSGRAHRVTSFSDRYLLYLSEEFENLFAAGSRSQWEQMTSVLPCKPTKPITRLGLCQGRWDLVLDWTNRNMHSPCLVIGYIFNDYTPSKL